MTKCKNCNECRYADSPLCFNCREDAMAECKSSICPRLNRSDDGEVQLSNSVYESCKRRL